MKLKKNKINKKLYKCNKIMEITDGNKIKKSEIRLIKYGTLEEKKKMKRKKIVINFNKYNKTK